MTPTDMGKLWDFLGQTWGSKFYEQYGLKPNEAWSAMLGDVSTEAARFAARNLIAGGSAFPPTLPEFTAEAVKYRALSASRALPNPGAHWEDREAAASAQVRQFATYGAYDAWRLAQKPKPAAHPAPGSPDWWYLHRLAIQDAATRNRRVGSQSMAGF